MKILPREGYPVCTVTYRDRGLIDMQVQVEYVVNAIRRVAQRSGRKIAVIGHSQGAALNSYALRFWPDLARKVEDFIGVAGTYTYGTDLAAACAVPCPSPLVQEFKPGSSFMAAMARTPLPPGPSYTAYSTRTDTAVLPQPKAGKLEAPGARSYTLQDLCPGDLYEHDLLVATAATVALTLDAFSHPGPAAAERLSRVPCGLVPRRRASRASCSTRPAGPSPQRKSSPRRPNCAATWTRSARSPRLRPALQSTTTPAADRRAPFAFTTSGTLDLPEGAVRGCEGNVTVQIKRGRHTVAHITAPVSTSASPLGPDCEFSTQTTVPQRARGELRVITRYAGSAGLLPADAPSQGIRAAAHARAPRR